MDHSAPHEHRRGFFASPWNIGLVVFLAIAGFYLITEHRAHVFGVLPFLLLLACPLMHFFMHGKHGGHGGYGGGGDASDSNRQPGAGQP
jgi:hypothetical protein